MYKNLEDIVLLSLIAVDSQLPYKQLPFSLVKSVSYEKFGYSNVWVFKTFCPFKSSFQKFWVFKCLSFQKFGFSNVWIFKSFGLQKFDIAAPNVRNQSIRMLSCVLVYYLWIFDVDVDEKKNRTIEAVRTLLYICIHCGECSCIVVLFKYKNERIQMPQKSNNILRTYTFEQPKIQSFWAKF